MTRNEELAQEQILALKSDGPQDIYYSFGKLQPVVPDMTAHQMIVCLMALTFCSYEEAVDYFNDSFRRGQINQIR